MTDDPVKRGRVEENGTSNLGMEQALFREGNLLRTLIDNLPDIIYAKDRESRFVLANESVARLMGEDTPAHLLGKTDKDYYPEELANKYIEDEKLVIEKGEPLISLPEECISQETGEILWYSTTKMPLFNENGDVIGIVGMGRDITRQKHAEEELLEHRYHLERLVQQRTAELTESNKHLEAEVLIRKKAEEEVALHRDRLAELVEERTRELVEAQGELLLKERLAALGQLTSTVAHELRNPLGTIRGAVYSLGQRMKESSPAVDRLIKLAERNVVRCDQIIEELLDYARATPPNLETVALDNWLDDVLDDLEVPCGVIVRRKMNSQAEVAIDSERLRRCVINVFNNACEAMTNREEMTEGKNDLTIQTRGEGERLLILFVDTGPGIPQESLQKIFEPLYSTKSFGVGLGLPTVRRAMRQHDGDVEVTSLQGKGTTVTLWLPLAKAESDTLEQ